MVNDLDKPIWLPEAKHFTTQRIQNEINAMSERELRMWFNRWERQDTLNEKRRNQKD
jgi:hypothetical protein